MLNLIAASAYFLLIHFGVSGTKLRDTLVARLGEGPYRGRSRSPRCSDWCGLAARTGTRQPYHSRDSCLDFDRPCTCWC